MSEARLGFAIDSSAAIGAASDLDRLTASSGKAEQAANKVSIAATKASRSFGDIGPVLERIVAGIEQLNQTSTSISSKLDMMARAATGAARAAKGIGDAANDAGRGVDNLSDKIRKSGDSARSFGDQASHVAAFRSEIDRLTAKFQPLTVASKAYEANITEIQSAHRLGIISTQQMTAELEKERTAFDRLSAAANKVPGGKPNPANNNGISEGNKRFIGRDLAFQAQDIAVTAVGGMSPKAIALQQGTQVAGALAGLSAKEAGGALLSAATSLISPVAIASVALTGLTAAAIQYFTNTSSQVKSLDDLLDDHTKIIKRIGDAYGGVAEQAAKAGSDSKGLIDALGTRNQTALRLSSVSEGNSFFQSRDVGRVLTGGRFGDRGASFHAVVPQFQQDLAKLRTDFKAGKPDFDGFYEAISRKVELDPSLATAGVKVIAESEKFKSASDAMKEYQRVRQALFNDQGPGGRLLSQGTTNTADMGNYALYKSQQDGIIKRSKEAFDAQVATINARTLDERVAASRQTARAQHNDESQPVANNRIDLAAQMTRIELTKQLTDAQDARERSLAKSAGDQQLDISLIGKTAGQAASLRAEYEGLAAINAERHQRGIKDEQEYQRIFGAEIDIVKRNADEMGRLADNRARAALNDNLSFQKDQFGRTPEQRSIAEQLRGAGLAVDLNSADAKKIGAADDRQTEQTRKWNKEGFSAQLQGITARTDAERVAAARAAASAQHNPTEPTPLRQQRIDNAGALAQAQIDKERDTATRDRSLSLDRMLASQKEELSLVGQTGGAAEGLRKQYELIAALQDEAAKNGGIVSAAEVARIKEATAAYGEMVDKINLAKLNDDLDFQSRQLGRTPQQQQIASTLRQNGQPEDFNSPIAQRLKKQDQQQTEKGQIDQFSTNLASGIIQSGGDVGKAFGQAFLSSLQDVAQKQLTNIFSQLLTSVLMPNAGAGATTQAAVAGGAGSIASKILGGANDNKASAAVPSTDVASYITQAAIKRGIDPSTALAVAKSEGGLNSWNMQSGVIKNGVQEPSFGPFQLYKGGGLGNEFQKKTGLDPANATSGPAGVDFALDHAAKNGWGSWYGAKNTGISNWQGIGSGGVGDAADAASKFADATTSATKSLGGFDIGIGKIGQQLGGAGAGGLFPAAPSASGGGGIFGWLGSLFSSPFKAMGPQGAAALAGTLKPGLFASGTNYAPGGPAIVGENGPELLDLPQGSQVTSNHKLMSALAANSNQQQPNRQLNVSIQGASGDDHVRSLVQQGVGAALSDYNTQQRRGGVGVLQARYSNQKV